MNRIEVYEIIWFVIHVTITLSAGVIVCFIVSQQQSSDTNTERTDGSQTDSVATQRRSAGFDSRWKAMVYIFIFSLCRGIEFGLRVFSSLWPDTPGSDTDDTDGQRYLKGILFAIPLSCGFLLFTFMIVTMTRLLEFISDPMCYTGDTESIRKTELFCRIVDIAAVVCAIVLPIFVAASGDDVLTLGATLAHSAVFVSCVILTLASILYSRRLKHAVPHIPEYLKTCRESVQELMWILVAFQAMGGLYALLELYEVALLIRNDKDETITCYPQEAWKMVIFYTYRILEVAPLSSLLASLAKKHIRIAQKQYARSPKDPMVQSLRPSAHGEYGTTHGLN
eukprot:TRINITY_DN10859_c0_g2_i1.p1 TRINITY_DN10859_c0_g2~~TRINITY_DN10859_c0_g2_i1.p1  ORF type:complete len:338 (+),score=53.63 TRINITY_DN10859_c0_g2_i1:51-1064(+)